MVKQTATLPVLLVLGSVFGPAAHAGSGNAQFAGTVLSTCAVVIGGVGVLDINAGATSLSTTEGLGAPATAVVTATGSGFSIDIGTPSAFVVAPAGGGTGVTFAAQYSTTGITTVSGILAGVATPLGIGVTTASIDLTATKPDGFPAGVYNAETVVTCE